MRKVFSLLFSFFLFINTIHSSTFISKTGTEIEITDCQASDLQACEIIFIKAFSKAYEQFGPDQLGVKDKLLFLQEAFADVYDDFEQGLQILSVAKSKEKIIGFVGFKKTEKEGEIYISQLAVDPDHWQDGIGSHLVFSSFTYFPGLKSLVVIPRKINATAREFYTKLGFVQSPYMHPGYNPERYIGYEWTASKETSENKAE